MRPAPREPSVTDSVSQPEGHDLMLVYVAGAGGSTAVWPASLMENVVAPGLAFDLPGHGLAKGPGRRSVRAYASHLAANTTTMNTQRIVLVGHSMGAAVALSVARHHPDRFVGLVLVGAAARLRVAPALFHQLTTDFTGAAHFVARFGYHPTVDPALPAACIDQLLDTGSLVTTGDFLACNQLDARPWLAGIPCPVLVISGEADKLVPPTEAAALAAALPDGRFVSVPDAGHFVMQEQPEVVAAEMSAFIAGL